MQYGILNLNNAVDSSDENVMDNTVDSDEEENVRYTYNP